MYVRKVKKGGKIYSYYYKSQRIGDKVKSIYVGKAVEDIRKPVVKQTEPNIAKREFKKESDVINHLLEFDNLLNEINKLINSKDLSNAIFTYNKMFEVYTKIEINASDKAKVFERLNSVYNNLVELSKENKIELG